MNLSKLGKINTPIVESKESVMCEGIEDDIKSNVFEIIETELVDNLSEDKKKEFKIYQDQILFYNKFIEKYKAGIEKDGPEYRRKCAKIVYLGSIIKRKKDQLNNVLDNDSIMNREVVVDKLNKSIDSATKGIMRNETLRGVLFNRLFKMRTLIVEFEAELVTWELRRNELLEKNAT